MTRKQRARLVLTVCALGLFAAALSGCVLFEGLKKIMHKDSEGNETTVEWHGDPNDPNDPNALEVEQPE